MKLRSLVSGAAATVNPLWGAVTGFFGWLGFKSTALLAALLYVYVSAYGLPVLGGGAVNHWKHRAAGWEHVAAKWKDAHEKQVTKFNVYQQDGLRKKQAAEDAYNRLARRADDEEHEANRLRAAAARYAAANRVRRETGPVSGPADDSPAEGGDGPGDLAERISITRNDYDKFVNIAVRLKKVQDWGQRLIDEKRAVRLEDMPEPEFGQ